VGIEENPDPLLLPYHYRPFPFFSSEGEWQHRHFDSYPFPFFFSILLKGNGTRVFFSPPSRASSAAPLFTSKSVAILAPFSFFPLPPERVRCTSSPSPPPSPPLRGTGFSPVYWKHSHHSQNLPLFLPATWKRKKVRPASFLKLDFFFERAQKREYCIFSPPPLLPEEAQGAFERDEYQDVPPPPS